MSNSAGAVIAPAAVGSAPVFTGIGQPAPRRQRVTGLLEERFVVQVNSSPRASAWVAAHRAFSLPFYLRSTAHSYVGRRQGRELRMVGVGRPKRFLPLFRRLMDDVQEVGAARRTPWRPAWVDDPEVDLVVSEIHRWSAPSFRSAGWLTMPDAIRWGGDLAMLPPPAPCRSLREDLKKVRRYQYVLEQSTAWADWEAFYDSMLVPQAVNRFGETGWLPSRPFMRELASRGILHFLSRDGQRVAGSCTVRNGDTAWIPLTGVAHGSTELLHQGVFVALIFKTWEWARTQGCRRIDAGRTAPFMHDGVPRNKHKWGLRPVPDPLSHLVALRVGPSPELRQAFTAQPVAVETANGLEVYGGE